MNLGKGLNHFAFPLYRSIFQGFNNEILLASDVLNYFRVTK